MKRFFLARALPALGTWAVAGAVLFLLNGEASALLWFLAIAAWCAGLWAFLFARWRR